MSPLYIVLLFTFHTVSFAKHDANLTINININVNADNLKTPNESVKFNESDESLIESESPVNRCKINP